MKASDIMTLDPSCCSSNDSLRDVAQLMRDNDCGAVPVIDDGCIVGIVTDRDLAVRALADGKGADAKVGDVITCDPCCCKAEFDGQRVTEREVAVVVERISTPRRSSFDRGAQPSAEQRL